MKLRLITRSSKLAMWQTEYVAEQLQSEGCQTEIIPIETKGDKILSKSISKIGEKGVFTEELEDALLSGTADLAVHSSKDLPSSLPQGLSLVAFGEREQINDVLVSHHQGLELDRGITIGTSSTRRVGLLKCHYPQHTIVPMRGNLQTRFQKMENGDCDALLLAAAGVKRMGLDQYIIHEFDSNEFVPQAGQGSIAIEIADSLDEEIKQVIRKACNNSAAETAIRCERTFLEEVQGGCSVPVFAYATINKQEIELTAGIVGLNGEKLIKETNSAVTSNYKQLASDLAHKVLSNGGKELLESIKQELHP